MMNMRRQVVSIYVRLFSIEDSRDGDLDASQSHGSAPRGSQKARGRMIILIKKNGGYTFPYIAREVEKSHQFQFFFEPRVITVTLINDFKVPFPRDGLFFREIPLLQCWPCLYWPR